MSIVTTNFVVCIVILTISLYYDFAYSRSYPYEGREVSASEVQWIAKSTREIALALQNRRPGAEGSDTARVLFVGTSQTWGSGARNPEESFVPMVESILNQRSVLPNPVRCLNFGVPGQDSHGLLKAYVDSLVKANYDLVCINLSHNDRDPLGFARNLTEFVQVSRAHGTGILFMLEPASPERWPDDLPLHHVMRAVASEMTVPVIDIHEHLKEHRDAGFLWWDYVHPTSFGHKLIAQRLEKELRHLLTESPLPQ